MDFPTVDPADPYALTPEEESVLAGIIPEQSATAGDTAGHRRSREEERVIQTEVLLIQMIIRHGEKILCNVRDDETGDERPLSVAEFVSYSLAEDGLQLRVPLHQRLMEEAVEHLADDGFRCTRYFENHPDGAIASLAIELAYDKETLSKIHSKGIQVSPEEERLMDIVPHLMTDYKLAIIEETIARIQQEMRSPDVLKDKARLQELTREFMENKAIQKELGRKCGDRVLAK